MKFLKIFFIAVICMFIVISTILIKQSVESNADYYKYNDVTVPVSAYISNVVRKDDPDGNTSYKTYLTYEYGNKTYYGIYWDTFSSRKTVGQQVTIKIFPNNPARIFENDIGSGDLNGATYMFCSAVCILIFLVRKHRKGENEDASNIIDAEFVYRETKPKLVLLMIFISIALARIILISMYPSFVNYNNTKLSTCLVITISIVLFVYELRKSLMYSLNDYRPIRSRCTGRKTDSDADGTDYYLVFAEGSIHCTSDEFYKTVTGDTFWLLLNKKKKILAAYSQKTWRIDFHIEDEGLYRKKSLKNFGISVIASLIIAIMFVACFSIILHMMQC